MIDLDLSTLGIISGEQKRALECFIDSRYFDQRKSYDEYTLNAIDVKVHLGIKGLMILAEDFKVVVSTDSVILSDYRPI